MAVIKEKKPYFGLTGGWLTVWVTVCSPKLQLYVRLPLTLFRLLVRQTCPYLVMTRVFLVRDSVYMGIHGSQLTCLRWCRDYQGLPPNPRSRGTDEDQDFINGDSHIRCWMFLRGYLGIHTRRALRPEEVYFMGNHYHGYWHSSPGHVLQSAPYLCWSRCVWVSVDYKTTGSTSSNTLGQ